MHRLTARPRGFANLLFLVVKRNLPANDDLCRSACGGLGFRQLGRGFADLRSDLYGVPSRTKVPWPPIFRPVFVIAEHVNHNRYLFDSEMQLIYTASMGSEIMRRSDT